MPNTSKGGGISRKIVNSEDRKRIRSILQEINIPENMGLIVRTAGLNKTKNELNTDISNTIGIWEEIKTKEKSKIGRKSVLDGIPSYLPSLQRSQKLQKKAAKQGFDWDEINSVLDKLDEEVAEFKNAVQSGKKKDMKEELGDIFFVLVNIAKFNKIDAEEALRATNNKFIKRFQHIEAEVSKRGKTLKETPLEELEQYWQDAKSYKSPNE